MILGYVFDLGYGRRKLVYADSRFAAEELLAADLGHRKFRFMGEVPYKFDDKPITNQQSSVEESEK